MCLVSILKSLVEWYMTATAAAAINAAAAAEGPGKPKAIKAVEEDLADVSISGRDWVPRNSPGGPGAHGRQYERAFLVPASICLLPSRACGGVRMALIHSLGSCAWLRLCLSGCASVFHSG
jgi:hypothetical protein